MPGKDRRRQRERDKVRRDLAELPQTELARLIQTLEEEMHEAAAELRFEYAARLRDEVNELRRELREAGCRSDHRREDRADEDTITVRGAREHNLKNISVELPRDKLIVLTGLSGSGKSSLAFDTIYAEGQRRYVESLSAVRPPVPRPDGQAGRRLHRGPVAGHLHRPEVGLPEPALHGRHHHRGLRLPAPPVGPHRPAPLPRARRAAGAPEPAADRRPPGGAPGRDPLPGARAGRAGRKGEYETLLEDLSAQGFVRARIDGDTVEISEFLKDGERLARYEQHTIEVVVDRLVRREGIERRLTDSVETALKLAEGVVEIEVVPRDGAADGEPGAEAMTFSQHLACPVGGESYEELAPRNFSFNSPYGACPACDGLGTTFEVDPELVVPNPDLSIGEGAISPWSTARTQYFSRMLEAVAEANDIDLAKPWGKLTKAQQQVLLYGTKGQVTVKYKNRYGRNRQYSTSYEGVIPFLKRRHSDSESDWSREQIETYMREVPCPACDGARLKPSSLAVTIGGQSISAVCDLSIADAAQFLLGLQLTERERMIAERVVKEINARMSFLLDVGLDYLTLSRSAGTLAGGEAQRIRLASQIGSGLVGVLYVLDEPRSASTSATTAGSSTPSTGCGTWATPSSSSSTTRRRSARPTGSSTSARAPESTAAPSPTRPPRPFPP